MVPLVGVPQDARGVRIVASEKTRSRRSTRRRADVAVCERHTFVRQTVNVRRIDVVVAMGADRVKSLLVCDDEDDVGALIGHSFSFGACSADHAGVSAVVLPSCKVSAVVGAGAVTETRAMLHVRAQKLLVHADDVVCSTQSES